MTALFLQVLDMSRVASLVILSVILVRFALKRVPKIYSYLLWGVVLFRLACPISIELPVSLIPEMESLTDSYQQVKLENSFMEEEVNGNTIGNSIVDMDVIDIYPTIDTWWQENEVVCVTQEEGVETQNEKTMNGKVAQKFFGWEVWIVFGSYIWLVGMIVMIGRSIFSYYKWKQQLLGNVCLRENIYLCDYIDSPFVMGMIKPRIYLPSFLKETEQEYIILHEQQHIKRKDHLTKVAAYVALCVHWFNPLVWLAFLLANKDMEMSCDEAVVGKTKHDIRAEYSASLLNLATGHRVFSGVPLAFGEGDTKGRIQNMARWKKPSLWIGIVSVIVVAIVGIVLAVNPEKSQKDEQVMNQGGVGMENISNEKNVERQIGTKSSVVEGEDGWYYVFTYRYPKDGQTTSGLLPYDFYGVNLKYRYLDDYMSSMKDVVNGELVDRKIPQPIQTLEYAKSEAMKNDLEEIASIFKVGSEWVTSEVLLKLTADDLTFEEFDEVMFLTSVQGALKEETCDYGKYENELPSYGLYEEKEYLDNYKFQVGFICGQGYIKAVAIDVLYREGKDSEADDYKQLSDMVTSGEASKEQKDLYERIEKIEEGIVQENSLSYDIGGNERMAGVYMPRLHDLLEMIEVNYWHMLND